MSAQLATIRNNEFYKIDNDIIRAQQHGYDSALYVIRYLLDQIQDSKFEDERTGIAIKMFKFINKNPHVLIYEPKFCNTVASKITEFSNQIAKKTKMFNMADYDKAIKIMKVSIRVNVHNSDTRSTIYKHLDAINSILNDYSSLSYYVQLKTEMDQVSRTIQKINTESNSINAL